MYRCQCMISQNTVIIIQKTQKAFDDIVKDVLNNNLKVSKSFKVKLEFIGNTNSSGNKMQKQLFH